MNNSIRDRIKEFKRVKASSIVADPKNPRRHNDQQRELLRGVFSEIGIAGALLVRKGKHGKYILVDGELRADELGDQLVPILVTDLDEKEGHLLLAFFDHLCGVATEDPIALRSLLQELTVEDQDLSRVIEDTLSELETEPETVAIREMEIKPLPKLAWVLVGIPITNYGEIAGAIEELVANDKTTIHTTVTGKD